jgi:hypothetical protein
MLLNNITIMWRSGPQMVVLDPCRITFVKSRSPLTCKKASNGEFRDIDGNVAS